MTRASLLALAALAAAPVLTAGAADADAGVIFRGGARIHFGGGIRIHTPRVYWAPRTYYAPRAAGVIWVGGGYYDYRWAAPPPPPAPCDCGPPPPLPTQVYYYPSQPVVAVPAPPPRRLARLGIGAFYGGVGVDDSRSAEEVGVVGRLRLTRGLIVEVEAAEGSYNYDDRRDDHVGASLLYEFGASHRWAPYILAGFGGGSTTSDYNSELGMGYGELGVGLRWAVTENFHLTVDVRGGSKATEVQEYSYADDTAEPSPRSVVIDPSPSPSHDDVTTEDYTRLRLGGVIYF